MGAATRRCCFRRARSRHSCCSGVTHAAKRFKDLYQRTIDFGGHPNERSVTGNMKMVEEPDRRTMLAILQHGDGVELDHALKTVAQCGMVSLEMLQVVFKRPVRNPRNQRRDSRASEGSVAHRRT